VSDANTSCPKCQAALPAGSAFCNRCGQAVPAAALSPEAPPSPAEPEQELWRGRFSAKAQAHLWFLWTLEVGVLFYLWFGQIPPEKRGDLFLRYMFAALALLPACWILWQLLAAKLATRYRLTTHRLFKDSGILARALNEVELMRIDDVAVRQNLLQRVFNVGVVTVIAPSDPTEPRLELVGVENPIEVKELIRGQVRKRRERSLHVENL
jgi:membrane protein YdbS with pleckstrin-like domain